MLQSRFLRSESLLGLSFLFTGLALLQLGLVKNNLTWRLFLPLFVLIFCGVTAAYFLQKRHALGDPLLIPLIFFLSGLGLVLTTRLAPAFITR